MNLIKFFMIWCMFFGTVVLLKLYVFPDFTVSGMAEALVGIDVRVSDYHSYTKAFDSKCDYYIECDSQGLKNVTLSYCYLTETNYSGWCDG